MRDVNGCLLTLGVKWPTVYGAMIPINAPSPLTMLLNGPTNRADRSNALANVPVVDKQFELTAIVKNVTTNVCWHSANDAAKKKTAAVHEAEHEHKYRKCQ